MPVESMSDVLWQLGISAVLILINGFFVAAEFALVSVRRTRVQELVAEGSGAARLVQKAIGDLTRYITGTQVGVTLTSLGLGWIGEPAAAGLLEQVFRWMPRPWIGPAAFTVAVVLGFIIITCVQIVVSELVPKSVALQRT
ncbi:MAG: CNNM domain-containing protein, partial [Candidatus Xenobia bacterium]